MKKFAILFLFILIVLSGVYILLFPSQDEFVEGDLYDEIIQRGTLKVGINLDSKPFGFRNKKGEIVGYDADLARYLAQDLLKSRNKVEFIPVTPSDRLIKAATGKVDIVISTVTITPQRQEVVAFSVPYDVAGQAVLVKSTSAIKSLTDLSGQTVGVVFGTTAEKNIQKLVPTANLLGFKSYQDAYIALKQGKISAITSDDTILSRFAMEDNSVKLLPKRYSKEPYGIAFKKGKSTVKLKEHLDFAIKDMQRKNVLQRLRKQWIG